MNASSLGNVTKITKIHSIVCKTLNRQHNRCWSPLVYRWVRRRKQKQLKHGTLRECLCCRIEKPVCGTESKWVRSMRHSCISGYAILFYAHCTRCYLAAFDMQTYLVCLSVAHYPPFRYKAGSFTMVGCVWLLCARLCACSTSPSNRMRCIWVVFVHCLHRILSEIWMRWVKILCAQPTLSIWFDRQY